MGQHQAGSASINSVFDAALAICRQKEKPALKPAISFSTLEPSFLNQKNVSIPPAAHSVLVSVWEQGASSGVLQRHHQSAFRIAPLPDVFVPRVVKAWSLLFPSIAFAAQAAVWTVPLRRSVAISRDLPVRLRRHSARRFGR